MFHSTRILATLSTLLIVSCASGPSGMGFDSAIGEWQTEFVSLRDIIAKPRMTIIDETKAIYEYQEGRILFDAVDDQGKWEGYWVEDGSCCTDEKDGSTYWGAVTLQFNDTYTRWYGEFDICGKGGKYPLDGFRQ